MATSRYKGQYNGQEISFAPFALGRMLSQAECEALCRGEMIGLKGRWMGDYIAALVRQGDSFSVETMPRVWNGHTLTDDEVAMLRAGLTVRLSNCVLRFGSKSRRGDMLAKWERGENGYYTLVQQSE